MPEFKLTLEQLTKINDIGARLSRDPAFLAAVENAMKGLLPIQSSANVESSTEVREVVGGDRPRVERTVTFGWSVPVADDGSVSVAAIVAQVGAFIVVGAKAAVAGVSKE